MAALAGREGSVRIGANTVAEIDQWTLDVGIDVTEATDFGDTWKEFITTLRGATGSFRGRFDPADTNGHVALQTEFLTGGSGVTLRLYVNGSNYYTGTALLTGVSKEASVSGLVNATYNFTVTGALSYV